MESTMLRFENQTLPDAEFATFIETIASALKELRQQGVDECSLGELLCYIGQDEDEVADDAWEESISLDSTFDGEVELIVAHMTGRIH
jgi:hypothetical protein